MGHEDRFRLNKSALYGSPTTVASVLSDTNHYDVAVAHAFLWWWERIGLDRSLVVLRQAKVFPAAGRVSAIVQYKQFLDYYVSCLLVCM